MKMKQEKALYNSQNKMSECSNSLSFGEGWGEAGELVGAFSEYFIIKGYTPKTVTTLTRIATTFIKWITPQNIELELVSYNDILAYVNHKKKDGNKQRTLQITVMGLNHFFNFLVAEHHYKENPTSNVLIKGVKRKTLHEILTPEELDTIYKTYITEIIRPSLPPSGERKGGYPPQSTNELARKRNKIILGLIIYQALRTEELAKLQVQDLQLREGKINIQGANRSEGRLLKLEAHQIYDLSDYINEIRKQILSATNKTSTLLFMSVGASLNFTNIMAKLMQTLIKTNPKIKSSNHIRTSVITNWLKLHNLRKVQYMAGHRYISSTEAYQVNNIDELKEDVNKYHPLC